MPPAQAFPAQPQAPYQYGMQQYLPPGYQLVVQQTAYGPVMFGVPVQYPMMGQPYGHYAPPYQQLYQNPYMPYMQPPHSAPAPSVQPQPQAIAPMTPQPVAPAQPVQPPHVQPPHAQPAHGQAAQPSQPDPPATQAAPLPPAPQSAPAPPTVSEVVDTPSSSVAAGPPTDRPATAAAEPVPPPPQESPARLEVPQTVDTESEHSDTPQPEPEAAQFEELREHEAPLTPLELMDLFEQRNFILSPAQWRFYDTPEEIDQLIGYLRDVGREQKLLTALRGAEKQLKASMTARLAALNLE